jgi:glycosyltransferase involved in cell wall biosynthesis
MKVTMVGDSLKKQGGIVTVEKLMIAHAPPEVEIDHISTAVDGAALTKITGFAVGLGRLIGRLLTAEVDIVHIHVAERASAYRKSLVVFIVKKIFRKPVILHSHAPEFHLFYPTQPLIIQKGLRYAFGLCDRFIAVSESWRSYYIETLGLKPEQTVALINPIQVPPEVPFRPTLNPINIVFLGRIGQRKGAFDLIRAFSLIPFEQRKTARLTLAGDGEIDKAQHLIESLDLTDTVALAGWLSAEERDQLLAQANIFVLPSYNEGLPVSVLEAMGWGLPVITTPVGGIPGLIDHQKNGLLVTPGNINQLAAALQTLIQDEALRWALGEHARQHVLPFNISNYFSDLLDIYNLILRQMQ